MPYMRYEIQGESEENHMSSATPSSQSVLQIARQGVFRSLPEALQPIIEQTRALSFWTAVLLPFLFIPALHSGVIGDPISVLSLLGFNILCAIFGHGYAK